MNNTEQKPIIIGLMGKAKSGKDTACYGIEDRIRQYEGNKKVAFKRKVHRIAFADPIREIGKMFGFTDEQMGVQELKETFVHPIWGITPRQFMQRVGSDMFRNNLHTDCWVQLAGIRINKIINESKIDDGLTCDDIGKLPRDIIIITDVRFPNEVKFIESIGGHIVKIDRPSNNTGDGSSWKQHESETALNGFTPNDVWINNSDTALKWQDAAGNAFASLVKREYGITMGTI